MAVEVGGVGGGGGGGRRGERSRGRRRWWGATGVPARDGGGVALMASRAGGVGGKEVGGVVLGGEAARVGEVVGEAVGAEGAGEGMGGVVEEDVAKGGGVGFGFAAVAVGYRAGGVGHPVGCRAAYHGSAGDGGGWYLAPCKGFTWGGRNPKPMGFSPRSQA